ncbi:DUF2007 domain-containing protein [uncultured Dokdonia sp.]|uniref:putative signal transducing protein n=1 Tax=uncultured Dokdonia sp. TaxID=575653 RepID=UPI0026360924|nr:DUF2007 domain-containing protein [uncultured Dokdonia sp.]
MNILPKSQYEQIFYGSQITTQHIKLVLEEAGISSVVRDDGESALRGGYGAAHTGDVKLFVDKKDVLKAKHLVTSTIEKLETQNISDEDLEKLSQQKDPVIPIRKATTQKKETYRRSPFNLFINVGLIILSIWRLSPLLKGETLSTLRIVVSTGILLFCSWAVIQHFTPKKT